MQETFHAITEAVATTLEGAAVALIAAGGINVIYILLRAVFTKHMGIDTRRDAWLSFARWLLLGLEFTLAADIVRTALAPTWDAIGQLGAIAVIRTFLSYFLGRDLETAYKDEIIPRPSQKKEG